MYHLHPLAALAIKTIPRLLDTLHVLSFPELVSAAGAQHFHRAEGCRSIAAGVFSFFFNMLLACAGGIHGSLE